MHQANKDRERVETPWLEGMSGEEQVGMETECSNLASPAREAPRSESVTAGSLREILEKYCGTGSTRPEAGRRFEVLVRYYLQTDPQYRQLFRKVWLWAEWELRGEVTGGGGRDIGIDLVAEFRGAADGEPRFCAIQCKFHSHRKLGWEELGSFLGASEWRGFRERWLVSTAPLTEEALRQLEVPERQGPAFHLLTLEAMESSPINWNEFRWDDPELPELPLRARREPQEHQVEAIQSVLAGLERQDRGQLIMACGTGKTFVSLRVAERWRYVGGNGQARGGRILFLAPSIALVGQSLRAWTADAAGDIRAVVVCSDRTVGRVGRARSMSEDEDARVMEIPYPVTTDPEWLREQLRSDAPPGTLTVVFSTYQSLSVLVRMQEEMPEWTFDLVICDEAHRTTGYTAPGEAPSDFTLVHDANRLRAQKRLYMTATPRMYPDAVRERARQQQLQVYSMEDEGTYGPVLHRLTFAEAVERGILSDYRVLVLAVDSRYASQLLGAADAEAQRELNLDDTARLVGCWNGLAKKFCDEDRVFLEGDTQPMRTALGFASSIASSKRIARQMENVARVLAAEGADGYQVTTRHVDGTMDAMQRQEALNWLAGGRNAPGATAEAGCRVLTNARCLMEGVDVPELDAIIFFQPRNSFVDVVQAVGRVMRRPAGGGKRFGYVLLPVVIPEGVDPDAAMEDNDRYRVIWQVLNALRSHDDRLERELAQLGLPGAGAPRHVNIIGIGAESRGAGTEGDGAPQGEIARQMSLALSPPVLEQWRQALVARMALRCTNRLYWEDWAREVTTIAAHHVTRLETALKRGGPFAERFRAFTQALRSTLRDDLTEREVLEMLAQHLITRPVFDALFGDYAFAKNNPVSESMEAVLAEVDGNGLESERRSLQVFYESVRRRVEGITAPEARQRVITELYQRFFQLAFPAMAEQLGIVYTPVEVVDFILRSVQVLSQKHFGKGLGDEGVDILDPFAGTGTFLVRLMELGLISPERLPHKYDQEMHANEVVLLAYYLAAINIEEAFHRTVGGAYRPFPGMVLADTFRMQEAQAGHLFEGFRGNSERVARQKGRDIRVVIGNPPHSAWQKNANENRPNQSYPELDRRLKETYGAGVTVTNRNSLYDHYIRAFRWASDRMGNEGIIGFVTNGGWLDTRAMSGFRRCLVEEFTEIYVLNLRGNARTQGELRRAEGDNVFGSGSRSTIAITLLVKKAGAKGPGRIYYHDIGDDLSREEKLQKLATFRDAGNVDWKPLVADAHHDWLNQRRTDFENLYPLIAAGRRNAQGVFAVSSNGVKSNRDIWVYHPQTVRLRKQVKDWVDFFHAEQQRVLPSLGTAGAKNPRSHGLLRNRVALAAKKVNYDPKRIKWGRDLFQTLVRGESITWGDDHIRPALYRPFFPLHLAFHPRLNSCLYKLPVFFPAPDVSNRMILVEGTGGTREFSCLLTEMIADFGVLFHTRCFPRYYYIPRRTPGMLPHSDPGARPDTQVIHSEVTGTWERRDAITDEALLFFQSHYNDPSITKDDIFDYVYGVLHAPDYRERYASNLRKELPRIPLARDFRAFVQAGQELARLHLGYATATPYPLTEEDRIPEDMDKWNGYRVMKMKFGQIGAGQKDKSVILFNEWITLRGIPPEAYDYVVNGKSAVEWVMECYQYRPDKETGIVWDPNDLARQKGDPRYVLDLLRRIITVSLETMRIVAGLPPSLT